MSSDTEVRTGELLPAAQQPDPDASVLEGLAGELVSFFTIQLPRFFIGAKVLETEALAAVQEAKAFVITDVDGHQRVLEFIKRRKEAKRNAENYWDITAKFHAVHTRMTGRRGVTTGAEDLAISTATKTAKAWDDAERARVREENARRQREADEAARLEQEARAKQIEEDALALEAAADELSEREKIFVTLVAAGNKVGVSAKAAGFKDAAYGERLMGMTKIKIAIEKIQQAAHMKRQAESVRQRPVESAPIEREVANVGKVSGLRNTVTKKCVVFDVDLWRAGVLEGKIPADTMMPNQSVLDGHAKSKGAKINAWPGCRYDEKKGMAG